MVYGPILVRIARSQSGNHGSNGARSRTAIVDHGMRNAKPDRHGKDEGGDGDRKHGDPAAVASSRRQQQRPVRDRDQCDTLTAHCAAPVLEA